jgi:hypothetical protein
MVKHVIHWRLKENAHGNTKAENAKKIKEMVEGLYGKIPGLLKIEVGFDYSNTENSSDICLYSEFESKEALEGYQIHPDHKAVVPFIVGAVEEKRLADYEI